MKRFDLSGFSVRITGLTADLDAEFDPVWAAFESSATGPAFLEVELGFRGAPAPHGVSTAKNMVVRGDASHATFEMDEGRAELDDHGRLRATLAPSTPPTQYIALINLILPALAWRMAARGGAAVHAAAVVLDGRAVLLAGQSGAGKSTFARLAEDSGATVLGDDLVFVDASGPRPEVLGTPLRPRSHDSPGPGRWPLELILFSRHGDEPRLDDVDTMPAQARLLANLPWVTRGVFRDGGPHTVVDSLVARVPVRTLTFAPDTLFVGLLREFLTGQSSR